MKETRCTDSGIVEREAIFPDENGDMPGYGDTAACGDDEEYEENAGELDECQENMDASEGYSGDDADDFNDYEVSKDAVSSVSIYKKIRERHCRYPEYNGLSVDRLLYIYHIVETDRKKRAWLRDEIFLRTYFLIPYTIKKSYFMTADLFNDASQNMAISILQAIEAFQPGIGFSFTNYLVGYFRGAIAQSFRETNIVSIPSARRKMLRSVTENSGGTPAHETVSLSGIENPVADDESGTADAGDEPQSVDVEMRDSGYAALGNTPATATLFDDSLAYHTQREANSHTIDFDALLHDIQLVEFLEDAISPEAGVLTDDERRVLVLHNGLFGNKETVYKDIAKLRKAEGKGCAPSRISQIHTSAISKLRGYFNLCGLEEY